MTNSPIKQSRNVAEGWYQCRTAVNFNGFRKNLRTKVKELSLRVQFSKKEKARRITEYGFA